MTHTQALALLCWALVVVAIPLAADGASRSEATPTTAAAKVESPPPSCPVTVENGSTPPGERPAPGYHGNGELWTALWSDGAVLMRPEDTRSDGSMAMKWPWWRGVPGQLHIEGHRLDDHAPPLRAESAAGGRLDIPITPRAGIRYGKSPPGFQATMLVFPTEGCWEVTGHVGDASLTFVVWVVRVDRWPWMPAANPAPAR